MMKLRRSEIQPRVQAMYRRSQDTLLPSFPGAKETTRTQSPSANLLQERVPQLTHARQVYFHPDSCQCCPQQRSSLMGISFTNRMSGRILQCEGKGRTRRHLCEQVQMRRRRHGDARPTELAGIGRRRRSCRTGYAVSDPVRSCGAGGEGLTTRLDR
jgi:hypothetical protein